MRRFGFIGNALWVVSILLTVWIVGRTAWGETARSDTSGIWYGAQILQPWYKRGQNPRQQGQRIKALKVLVGAISAASAETGIPGGIALAVARRESSLLPSVGRCEILGSRGEQGYFQVMPGGVVEREHAPADCDDMTNPLCNARTALRAMASVRDRCEGSSPWVWVGVYGRGHHGCPSEAEVREWAEVARSRTFYCQIARDCSRTWPE